MNQRRAMSLIETLFAVFVLLAAFTIFGTLFQWVMTSSKRGDQAATGQKALPGRTQVPIASATIVAPFDSV